MAAKSLISTGPDLHSDTVIEETTGRIEEGTHD